MKNKILIIKHFFKGFSPKARGFTLLEVLIALFIFSIISLILSRALHNVITIVSGTEATATRVRELQHALLIFSRDVEQIIDRPILGPAGTHEPPFIGSAYAFQLTHLGFTDTSGHLSHLQRAGYEWHDQTIWRKTWTALDQPPQAVAEVHPLLRQISATHFEYLGEQNHFYDRWPPPDSKKLKLPRAIKITFTIANWGTMSQLYALPPQTAQAAAPPPPNR